MGWKTFQEHYGIEHIVCINRDGNLSICSAYIRDIIVIRPDGTISKVSEHTDSKSIKLMVDRFASEPDVVRSLIETPDTFTASIPVYSCSSGKLVEKFCEKTGWPNCTHDGELMYDNQFYARREDAIAHGIRQCESWIELIDGNIVKLTADLQNAVSEIAEWRGELETLKTMAAEAERSKQDVHCD